MILETAFIKVKDGEVENFLAVLPRAKSEVLDLAEGFISLGYQVGIEREHTVLLSLKWETLEDHTIKFRGGELFTKWRELIGPFFAEAPVVEHWEIRA